MNEIRHIEILLEQIYDLGYNIGAIHRIELDHIKIILEERNNRDVDHEIYGANLSEVLEEALTIASNEPKSQENNKPDPEVMRGLYGEGFVTNNIEDNERIMFEESLCKNCIKCNLNNGNSSDSCKKSNWCNWKKQCDEFIKVK